MYKKKYDKWSVALILTSYVPMRHCEIYWQISSYFFFSVDNPKGSSAPGYAKAKFPPSYFLL